MNAVYCPPCFEAIGGGEEKCCSHGCFDAKCVRCGADRRPTDPFWSCTGTMPTEPRSPYPQAQTIDAINACAVLPHIAVQEAAQVLMEE